MCLVLLAVGFVGCGANSSEIKTLGQARGYVKKVLQGGEADRVAAAGASIEVQMEVARAQRIARVRSIYEDEGADGDAGWVCDAISVMSNTGEVLGPSRDEVVSAIQTSSSYQPAVDSARADNVLDALQPGDALRHITRSEAIDMADKLCDAAEGL